MRFSPKVFNGARVFTDVFWFRSYGLCRIADSNARTRDAQLCCSSCSASFKHQVLNSGQTLWVRSKDFYAFGRKPAELKAVQANKAQSNRCLPCLDHLKKAVVLFSRVIHTDGSTDRIFRSGNYRSIHTPFRLFPVKRCW